MLPDGAKALSNATPLAPTFEDGTGELPALIGDEVLGLGAQPWRSHRGRIAAFAASAAVEGTPCNPECASTDDP